MTIPIDPSLHLGVTAANGLSPGTLQTWSTDVARTPRVLVPVQVDALVLRPGAVQRPFADLHMNAPAADGDTKASDLMSAPFTDLPVTARPSGVYLHWALPDALTNGAQSGDGQLAFPPIPDRWLVVRLSPSALPGRRTVRGWVLCAWDQNPVAHDLATWVEPGVDPSLQPPTLSALGRGDLAWAAVYDNVQNRLSFHDPLDDVKEGPLAYLVCGWFASQSYDPLADASVRSLADFHDKLAAMAWTLPAAALEQPVAVSQAHLQAAAAVGLFQPKGSFDLVGGPTAPKINEVGDFSTAGTWWPRLTLYHGSVVGLGWPTPAVPGYPKGVLGGDTGGPPDPASVEVAMGETAAEALAALVARRNGAPEEARVLEAFQLDLMSELDAPDGAARVDQRLHASTFGSLPGPPGTEELLQRGTPSTPTPSTPGTPPPGIFADRHPSEPLPPTPPRVMDPLPATTATAAAPAADTQAETKIAAGGMRAALGAIQIAGGLLSGLSDDAGTSSPVPPPGPDSVVEVQRSGARFFHPADPVIMIAGGRRSFKHGGDGRFTQTGTLTCRATGSSVVELSSLTSATTNQRLAVQGGDLLAGALDNGSVPPECEELLRELALLDPGSATLAATVALPQGAALERTAAAGRFAVEQTAWWAIRDRRVDQAPLLAQSGLAGTLPSPIAVTPPVRPWTPLLLEWQVRYLPSPGGASDWNLGEIDLSPNTLPPPGPNTPGALSLTGRSLLTGGAAATAAAAARRALDQAARLGTPATIDPDMVARFSSGLSSVLVQSLANLAPPAVAAPVNAPLSAIDRSELGDIVSALESLDVMSGALGGLHTGLRGGFPGDGASAPTGDAPAVPIGFHALRAGALELLRLRLVDGFGQVVDLAGSDAVTPVAPERVLLSEPLAPPPDHPGVAVLAPRFTAPARVTMRYTAADGSDADADADVSPVCGYLLTNHLDGALELFAADGDAIGSVRPDPDTGVAWSDTPGQPSPLRTGPPSTANAALNGISDLLLRWGVADAAAQGGASETALSALLRIIDSTLWSVDPYAHIGDEHMSLLVGHPVVVLRARLRLELQEPIDAEGARRIAVPVRLGALAHWQDGLFGYFVDDDYGTLYCADRAAAGFAREVGPGRGFLQSANLVDDYYQHFADDLGAGPTGASPVGHPYVATSEVFLMRPDQEVKLTLLVEPHGLVNVTSGVVPRKEVGMRRQWLVPGLERLAPTFRFGPVLVDPKSIRLPVASDLPGVWSWDHRADAITWANDDVSRTSGDARLAPGPASAQEGWLRFQPDDPSSDGDPGTSGGGT